MLHGFLVIAPSRNAAHYPGWPLQRQGHPEIVSNRFAETIFGTHPLSAGDLCQPSGPDGEGQARGQAPNARDEPPKQRLISPTGSGISNSSLVTASRRYLKERLGSCSELVLVPCRHSDRVGVVDDVKIRDLVAVRFEGEEVHHLERDHGSVPDCPVVLEIRGGVILA
jgi:hypothetical protein